MCAHLPSVRNVAPSGHGAEGGLLGGVEARVRQELRPALEHVGPCTRRADKSRQQHHHRERARRHEAVAAPPAGEPGAVRGGRGDFERERKKQAAMRARSAPGSAADSSSDSCSSAMHSIRAAGVVCGHGRAAGTKVSTWLAGSVPDPEHMTRAGACPAAGGHSGARRALMSNAPGVGGSFAKGARARVGGPSVHGQKTRAG